MDTLWRRAVKTHSFYPKHFVANSLDSCAEGPEYAHACTEHPPLICSYGQARWRGKHTSVDGDDYLQGSQADS
eukprot:366300-Chlamydomonas_euryale.AAC.11